MVKRNSGKVANLFSNLLIALIAALVGVVFARLLTIKPKPPQFIIETPVVEVGEPIIIKAANKKANRNEPLNVEFDKHVFENAGEPFKYDNDNEQRWRFNIMKVVHTPEMIKIGGHKMRFGFNEEDLCKEEQAVSFKPIISHPPPPSPNIVGFYKALIENGPGSTRIITLTIKKVNENPGICTIEYILAGYQGITSGEGSLNLSEMSIYIPGLEEGKVWRNQEGKFILNFTYNGKEVQFVQSDI